MSSSHLHDFANVAANQPELTDEKLESIIAALLADDSRRKHRKPKNDNSLNKSRQQYNDAKSFAIPRRLTHQELFEQARKNDAVRLNERQTDAERFSHQAALRALRNSIKPKLEYMQEFMHGNKGSNKGVTKKKGGKSHRRKSRHRHRKTNRAH